MLLFSCHNPHLNAAQSSTNCYVVQHILFGLSYLVGNTVGNTIYTDTSSFPHPTCCHTSSDHSCHPADSRSFDYATASLPPEPVTTESA